MQLISKNNKYKKVKRFQGGNTIQRDNTRMVSKPEPRLKKEPQLPIQIQSNQTFLSPMPNRSAALDEQAKVNAIKNEAYNNLERTKYANFWTAPYAGFSGKQAFDLGTNLVKESTYTAAGEILLPLLGKAASKGINKLLPKVNKTRFSNINTTGSSSTAENVEAFNQAMKDVYDQVYLGDEVTLMIPKSTRSQVKINPDIQNRINRLGLKPREHSQITIDNQVNSKPELLVQDGFRPRVLSDYKNKLFNLGGNQNEIGEMLLDMRQQGATGGFNNGNLIINWVSLRLVVMLLDSTHSMSLLINYINYLV